MNLISKPNWINARSIYKTYNQVDFLFCTPSTHLLYDSDKEDVFAEIEKIHNPSKFSTAKNVYFEPLSKYPRYKLTENTDKKRVIKPEKADIMVFSRKLDINTSASVQDVYKINSPLREYYFTVDPSRIVNLQIVKYKLETYLMDKEYADSVTGIEKVYSGNKVCRIDNKVYSFLVNLDKGVYANIIFDDELDNYINKNLLPMEDSDYKQLIYMLSSKDETVVEMGLKMIPSYNILDNACKIGILLYDNYKNIGGNKGFNSVVFKQVLDTLGINHNNLKYQEGYYRHTNDKAHVSDFIQKSTSEEDKEFGRNYLIKYFTSILQEKFDELNTRHIDLGISLEISIK